MTPEVKAVIIGLWRQGNEIGVIALTVGLPSYFVEKVINEYQQQLKQAQ